MTMGRPRYSTRDDVREKVVRCSVNDIHIIHAILESLVDVEFGGTDEWGHSRVAELTARFAKLDDYETS